MRDLCTFGFSSVTLPAGEEPVPGSADSDFVEAGAEALNSASAAFRAVSLGNKGLSPAFLDFFAAGGDCRANGDMRLVKLETPGD